ncbi:MAG: glycosyltransferase family 2 protein [Candidatus Levyibacteriota bacterium]
MISVIILSYNEEEVIEDCLKSVHDFADEIILVDSMSTDDTVKIAKKHKARVVENILTSFSEQRNLGLEEAKGDWIYYLDADERLTPDFIKEAKEIISAYDSSSRIAGYYVNRKTFYLNRDWHFTDKVQRLFYKSKLKEWYGAVHETPKVEGTYGVIESPILHFTHRNLEQMLEKTNKWSDYEAELRFKVDHPHMSWWRFPRVMIPEFFVAYIKQGGYKNGTEGLIESIYQAFSMFIAYAKLWELQNKKKK